MPLVRMIVLAAAAAALSACGTVGKLSEVGKPPKMTPIQHPAVLHDNQPVAMPMPAPEADDYRPNSLWRTGARSFFKDQRAQKVGDILTVNIDITDRAQLANSTSRTRSSSETAGATNFLGLENRLDAFLPDGATAGSLADLSSDGSHSGNGTVNRQETVDLTVAAVVTQILPNGNLVIAGRQEVRVNFEVRELTVTGVVRPEDISNSNQVQHSQIAEARISYGGRGQLTNVQQPRYGQQVYDIVFPF
ncbi:MAG: flagellar basal body L-ring protein FlgH [Pseudomonadota bacterium]